MHLGSAECNEMWARLRFPGGISRKDAIGILGSVWGYMAILNGFARSHQVVLECDFQRGIQRHVERDARRQFSFQAPLISL